MALYGSFDTIPLTDLLQWIETSRKTGTLELEHRLGTRSVLFREGRVIGCSSNDPPSLLGQILLARGLITEAQLGEALAKQEADGGILGEILVAMGAVSNEEVIQHVAAKVEETLYGLFDWEDAGFQFLDEVAVPPHLIEVDLKIQDILLKGLKRFDEMKRFREVFHDPGIVLSRTDAPLPPELEGSKATGKILALVDGTRSLAELLLHARASEYLVTKFLFEMHRKGLVQITGTRIVDPEPAPAERAAQEGAAAQEAEGDGQPEPDLSEELEVASRLLARGEYEAALAMLNAAARAYPGAPSVRQMIVRAEGLFQQHAGRDLPPERIPVLVDRGVDEEDPALSPGEAFLLTLIDGRSDIKSILWIAPMRTVEVLQALHKLLEKGLIDLL
jgi:hypothetical protein